MKKFLLVLGLLIFSTPAVAEAPVERTWFCRQNGQMNVGPSMFITAPWKDTYRNHYEEREVSFSKHIKKLTKGEFQPMFEAKCRQYFDPVKAKKHFGIEVRTAERYQASVMFTAWRWTPNVQKK